MNEEFKPVVGYEGLYEVSNLGNVKSLSTTTITVTGHSRTTKEKLLKPGMNSRGYMFVALSKKGKVKYYLVHRLVAASFIKNPTKKRTVNHMDGDRTNNKLSNLEWTTHLENSRHARINGLLDGNKQYLESLQVEKESRIKLTDQDVSYILTHAKKNGGTMNNASLGRMLGVTRNTVGRIVNSQTHEGVTA